MKETHLNQTKYKYIFSNRNIRYTVGGRQKDEASALSINLVRKSHFCTKPLDLLTIIRKDEKRTE